MKKPATRKKPAAKTRKKRAGPLAELFSGVDMDALRRMLAAEMGSVEDMLEPFLLADLDEIDDAPSPEAMSELAEELERLRVDANGGDPAAREALQRARAMIDEATEQDDIHPAVLMMLGRVFAGAGVDIGGSARASMGRFFSDNRLYASGDDGFSQLVQPLFDEFAGDDFDLHEEARRLSEIFPPEFRARLAESLAGRRGRGSRAAVGFLLDREETTALAALRGLVASASGAGLDAVARRRIARIRSWLPAARREALDSAFPHSDAIEPDSVPAATAVASACDGSGGSSLIAVVKRGARFQTLVLMANPRGIVDCTLLEGLTRAKADEVVTMLRASASSAATPMPTWLRLVRLALGRNLAGDTPPPFALVRGLEAIGVEALVPDLSTPADVIESLLAEAPPLPAPSLEAANRAVIEMEAADNWFEAGEVVETVLRATGGVEAGARALLATHLPGRRGFWATQCALTALALKEASPAEPWRELALVGRTLLSNAPLAEIPLMQQIATRSAAAWFEHNRARRGSAAVTGRA